MNILIHRSCGYIGENEAFKNGCPNCNNSVEENLEDLMTNIAGGIVCGRCKGVRPGKTSAHYRCDNCLNVDFNTGFMITIIIQVVIIIVGFYLVKFSGFIGILGYLILIVTSLIFLASLRQTVLQLYSPIFCKKCKKIFPIDSTTCRVCDFTNEGLVKSNFWQGISFVILGLILLYLDTFRAFGAIGVSLILLGLFTAKNAKRKRL
jgi:RNA polymerase subunit RPABC4/transcription elongation factor Spt4